MKIKKKALLSMFALFIIVIAIIIATTLISSDVSGANNDSTIAKVNIVNSAPDIYDASITPSNIDLTAGNITKIVCTGLIYDQDGWNDIKNITANLYDTAEGDGTTEDNNFRYINNSCGNSTTTCGQVSTTNATCNCSFSVWYYANNGTWQCNMSAWDSYMRNDTQNSTFASMNTVIAIDSPSEMDFGNLSVTETSSQKTANLTNFGNVPINVSIRTYGGTDTSQDYNYSVMNCEVGNITYTNQRYSGVNGTSWESMLNITNISSPISDFSLPVRINDTNYQNDTNRTYWRLYIPSSVSGPCNGTIEFYATETQV